MKVYQPSEQTSCQASTGTRDKLTPTEHMEHVNTWCGFAANVLNILWNLHNFTLRR